MRIVCEKCSAAYAIDDKFITPKGIRAQCPRCRHLQLVKKEAEAAAPVAAPPLAPLPGPPANAAVPGSSGAPIEAVPTRPRQASPFLFDLETTKPGGPPPGAGPSPFQAAAMAPMPPAAPPPKGVGGEMDFSELNFEADSPPPPPSKPGAAALPPASSSRPNSIPPPSKLFSAPSVPPRTSPPAKPPAEPAGFSFDNLAPPPPPGGAPPNPFAAPPPANPFGGGGLGSFAGPPQADPFDVALKSAGPATDESLGAAPSPTAEVQAVVKCKVCGKPLTDPFDQAIGTCDDCRNTPSPLTDEDKSLRTITGVNKIPGYVAPPTQPAVPKVDAQPAVPVEALPRVVTDPGLKSQGTASGVRTRSGFSAAREDRDEGGPSKAQTIGAVVVLAAVAAGAIWLGVNKPWSRRAPPLVVKAPSTQGRPFDRIIEAWRLRYLDDLNGSSADHLAAGEEQLAKDTTAGYRDAEEEFQKALVLDKGNDRAVAGWVLALAFGRGLQLDDATAADALELITVSEQRVQGCGRACTAHAHLLLARGGNLNDIQALAERGKTSVAAGDRALALLALGESLLSRNPQFAAQDFDDALKLDPKLKRAYLARSKLLLSQGRYREAVESLQKRLELDPEQWESSYELGKVYVEVGDVAAAKKVFAKAKEVDPKNFRARLATAVLAYQHEGNLKDATQQLDAMAGEADRLEKGQVVELLGHRAAAERLSNEIDAANGSIEKALELSPDDVNANLQRFVIALKANKAADARAVWPKLAGKLGDPALEGTLEGRLLYAEEKFGDAHKLLTQVVEKDRRRTDALLVAGAAAARLKIDSMAFDLALKKGLKAEPLAAAPEPVMARYFVRPADVLVGVGDAFAPLQRDAEDPNVPLARGLVAWHAGELAAAEKLFDEVLHDDPANAPGFALRTLVALKKKDLTGALRFGAKAAETGKQNGLAHTAYGMALLAANQSDLAKKELRQASDLEPAMLAPRVKLGEIEAKQKHPDEARKLLTMVLLQDPQYHEAERALFSMP